MEIFYHQVINMLLDVMELIVITKKIMFNTIKRFQLHVARQLLLLTTRLKLKHTDISQIIQDVPTLVVLTLEHV